MDYKHLEMLEKHACDELKRFAEQGFNSKADITTARELMSIVHKADCLMDKEGESMAMGRGYSGAGRWRADGEFGDRYAGDYDYSGRRGRNSMGRYTSYSYGGDVKGRLEELMQEVTDPKEREALERCLRDFR